MAKIILSAVAVFLAFSVVQAREGNSQRLTQSTSFLTQASNADAFYLRALKLERLGIRAPFDDDFKPLVSQARLSYRRLEQQNKNAERRGAPLYCNTQNEQLPPREVLKELGTIPAVKRRNMSLTRAFLVIAQSKYPCR